MIRIEILAKSVYGETRYYPNNHAALMLAQIAGTKTLTTHALRSAAAMGCDIIVDGDATLRDLLARDHLNRAVSRNLGISA